MQKYHLKPVIFSSKSIKKNGGYGWGWGWYFHEKVILFLTYWYSHPWGFIPGPVFFSIFQKAKQILQWNVKRLVYEQTNTKFCVYICVCISYLSHMIPKTSTNDYENLIVKNTMELFNHVFKQILQRLHPCPYVGFKNIFLCILDYFLQLRSRLQPRLGIQNNSKKNSYEELNQVCEDYKTLEI